MGGYGDEDIVVTAAKRSIMGSAKGSIKELESAKLGYYILDGLLRELEESSDHFRRSLVKKLITGQAVQAGTGQSLPRQIAALCSIPPLEAALTINELCGSSLEAVIMAIHSLQVGEYPLVLAGGVESLSTSPYLLRESELLKWQYRRVEELIPYLQRASLYDALWCRISEVHTIVHAERVTADWVKEQGLEPELFKAMIDRYAIESNERALKAVEQELLSDEIVTIPGGSAKDELPAPKKPALMAKRRGTRFTPEGFYLTNHNSPPPANCAAFLLLMSYRRAKELELEPLVRINGYFRGATEHESYLLAPIAAIRGLLERGKREIDDYDIMELNSAYGSQVPIMQRELGFEMAKVNIYGDSLAYGHPIGAAGARLLTTLIYALIREEKRLGLVSICMGGGNGIAIEVERC